MSILTFTKKGIYCPQADVFIDPIRKVKNAIITHGHSDHARIGHENYLCVDQSLPIIKHRLGKINVGSTPYGQSIDINGVKFSFHPAGHIIGSAQIRAEYKGEIWVVSGDYKLEEDGISEPFEPIKCHHFVTESTFALPIYNWLPQKMVFNDFNNWWQGNKEQGKISMVTAYSLGKAQRILANIDHSIGKIFCHSAVQTMNETIIKSGIRLPKTYLLKDKIGKEDAIGALIIGPYTGTNQPQFQVDCKMERATMSGWMQLRKRRKNGGVDRAFVLSDHVDWKGINKAVELSEAENIYVTHGYEEAYSKWLCEKGYNARSVIINHSI